MTFLLCSCKTMASKFAQTTKNAYLCNRFKKHPCDGELSNFINLI